MQRRQAGFTLIELMIVVVIVSLLAAVAYPSYTAHVTRSALNDGFAALSDWRIRMEQFYFDRRTYQNSGACGIAAPAATGYFSFSCSAPTANTYTLTATGNASSTTGFVFTLNQANVRATTATPSRSPWSSRTSTTEWISK
ncbi:MAG: prepilin-type N-terminal cleavage/methylation domain-containing protein [Burkholderiales bacterium]|nr:prepilin-type N-terminal cleavage/methylation domain-containing protein [Burkholderiales bacterium]